MCDVQHFCTNIDASNMFRCIRWYDFVPADINTANSREFSKEFLVDAARYLHYLQPPLAIDILDRGKLICVVDVSNAFGELPRLIIFVT